MKNRFINVKHIVQASFSIVLMALLSSCQEEFNRLIPDTEYGNDTIDVAFGTPRVLYIIADGARGESVRTAGAVNINGLLNQSIYSWYSLSDETVNEDGTNWADMLTGVRKNKHGVINNNFDDNNFDTFPLIFDRIKSELPESTIRVATSSSLFKENLTDGTDESVVLPNDEAVKNAVISDLSIADITLLVGHFKGIDIAGAQNGYDNSKPAYKNAILKFDEYIGEMVAALKARPTYREENWLIVVASSKGGHFDIPAELNDNTIFSNTDVNTFTIFHTPKYATRFIGKPYLGNRFQGEFVRFNGQRYAEVTAGDNTQYNFGSEAFSVELKVKKNPGPTNDYKFRYPAILGKRESWSSGWNANSPKGWLIFLDLDYWNFNVVGTGKADQVKGNNLADATWNTLSVVGRMVDGKRFIRTYTNGIFNAEKEVDSWGNFDNDDILRMGYMPGTGHGEPDVYIADVRIWQVALPDDVIKEYSCLTGVDEDHPYYDLLTGYWPVVGNSGDIILDEGPLGSHMTMRGDDYSWDRLAEYLCAPSSEDLGALVPKNVDVPAQIITWLKIARQESWQFDGRVWLDR